MAAINISAVKSCYGNSVITLSLESAEDLTAVADEASVQWTSGGTRPAISSRCRRRWFECLNLLNSRRKNGGFATYMIFCWFFCLPSETRAAVWSRVSQMFFPREISWRGLSRGCHKRAILVFVERFVHILSSRPLSRR